MGAEAYCEDVESWPQDVTDLEDRLVPRINELRAEPRTCGSGDEATEHRPGLPLALDPTLRCAGRVHARDLARRGDLSHEGQNGSDAVVRTKWAGYGGLVRHEVLAGGYLRASEVVDAWLASPVHCRALLDEDISQAGIGIARSPDDGTPYYVLLTGEPRA